MTDAPPRVRVRARSVQEPSGGPTGCEVDNHDPRSKVGYCSPPREHRFKSGQSGNPKGRPKGSRNIETLYREILDMKITTSVGGRTQTMTALKAVLIKQMQKALAGDFRSMEAVIEAQIRYAESQDARTDARELADRSMAILDRARERMRLDLAAEMGLRP